ncbi:hypothetical protein SGM_2608 [Streptomyces griseoaurantiacus M045]|uniref:Uncharacterized protein n=1 Tax=Streptomyces griseoaurantiacus M045 TaxID=996637 RepID=F3NHJ4_9ACTN|nr:hypothetical protein SGM_2608 [Streptomyces griseoaurantiacus M045]
MPQRVPIVAVLPYVRVSPLLTHCHHAVSASLLTCSAAGMAETRRVASVPPAACGIHSVSRGSVSP